MMLSNRRILGFYDSNECGEPSYSKIYLLAELPLNYLGFVVDYVDINEEISKIKKILKKYSKVIFWFREKWNEKCFQIKSCCKDKKVLVLDDSFIRTDEKNRLYWRINPLRFFEKFFEAENLPALDVSILNGNRIFFSNIDGDLFCGMSSLGGFNGGIILNEVLKKYPLPFTASWVVSEIENKEELINIAKEIISLDNIEGASHSFFHPSDWRNNHYPIDLDKEIGCSVNYLNKYVASEVKPIKMFLWPGLGNPTKEGLEKVYRLKIKNFNGSYNSMHSCRSDPLCFLPPYTYKIDGYVQFNCRSLNESSFSRTPAKCGAFSKVINIFERTDNQDFTLPINLYFHWYSGSNEDNLIELLKVLNWVSKQDITPIFTSEYVGMLEDFLSAQIFKEETGWVIKNKGLIRTVRFENCDKYIDFEKSENVIGYCHRNNHLYVFLNEKKKHRIMFQDEKPRIAYLQNANRAVKAWSVKDGKISFKVGGKGLLKFRVAVKPGKYFLKIKNKGQGEEEVIEVKDGVLSYSTNIDTVSLVTIEPLKDAISKGERIDLVNKGSRIFGLSDVFYLPEKVKFSINTAKADCRVVEGSEIIRITTEDMPKEEFNQLVLHEAAHILKSKLKKNQLMNFRKRLPSIRKRIKKHHKKAMDTGEKISPLNYLSEEGEIFARLLNYATIKGRPEYEEEKGKKPWHLIEAFNNKDVESILHVMPREFREAYSNSRLKEYFDVASQDTSSNCTVIKSLNDIKSYKLFFSEDAFKKETEIENVLKWLKKEGIKRIYLNPTEKLDGITFQKIINLLRRNGLKITLLTDGLFDNKILACADPQIVTDCIIDLKNMPYSEKDETVLKKNLSSLENTFIRMRIKHDFPLSKKAKEEVLKLLKACTISRINISLILKKIEKDLVKKQLNDFISCIKSFTKQNKIVNFEGDLYYCCLPKKEITFLKNKKTNFLSNSFFVNSDLKIHLNNVECGRSIEEFNSIKELYNRYKTERKENRPYFFKECGDCVYKKRKLC